MLHGELGGVVDMALGQVGTLRMQLRRVGGILSVVVLGVVEEGCSLFEVSGLLNSDGGSQLDGGGSLHNGDNFLLLFGGKE